MVPKVAPPGFAGLAFTLVFCRVGLRDTHPSWPYITDFTPAELARPHVCTKPSPLFLTPLNRLPKP